MKKLILIAFALAASGTLSACTGGWGQDLPNKDHEDVGIWVSPQGCDSWYFNDGTAAFMSPRLNAAGKPVCSHAPMPAVAGAQPATAAPMGATPNYASN
jgi:predicted small secreted protein